jgi:ATP-dependent helicase HrpA
MTALGLGDIAAFPFIEPPDHRQVRDGVALLEELGALDTTAPDNARRLTKVGSSLARLPVDPRLARMVLEADRNGCVAEVLVIAAALSIQDPRERPPDKRQAADASHRRFADERSDFLSYWRLWSYLQDRQQELSSSAFRRMCRAEFFHYLRVREWQELHSQLKSVSRSLGIKAATRGEHDPDLDALLVPLHTSLLAGLLSHVGLWDADKREYVGARGARFVPWPGSALFKKPPRAVMAGELVETSRLWGRDLGRIEPEWVEPLAAHLLKRTYSEPHWSSKQGAVMAYEKVTL